MKYLKRFENIKWEFDIEEEPNNDFQNIRNTFMWQTGFKDDNQKLYLKDIKDDHLLNIIRFVKRYKKGRYNLTYEELLDILEKEKKYRGF